MTETNNDPAVRDDLSGIQAMIEPHEKAMFDACYRVLGNTAEAEEAMHIAVFKALRKLPKEFDKDLRSWLCRVAMNAAKDLLRSKGRARRLVGEVFTDVETSDDPFWVSRVRMDTELFLGRVEKLLKEPLRKDLGLYLEVALGYAKQKELAARLGIPLNKVKSRRERVREAIPAAATVVYLTSTPDSDEQYCPVPQSYFKHDRFEDSPELLKKVLAHVDRCMKCERRGEDRAAQLRFVLAIPGVFLAEYLGGWRPKPDAIGKFVVAASVVAAIALLPTSGSVEPGPATPSTPNVEPPDHLIVAEPVTTAPPEPAPAVSTAEPSPRSLEPSPVVVTSAAVPPDPDERVLADRPSRATSAKIGRHRLRTPRNMPCDEELTAVGPQHRDRDRDWGRSDRTRI